MKVTSATSSKEIIKTYSSYSTTAKLEELLSEYVFDYLGPFLNENLRFSDLSSIGSSYIVKPQFENIVLSYLVFLNQKIRNYESTLERIQQLDEMLAAANNTPAGE